MLVRLQFFAPLSSSSSSSSYQTSPTTFTPILLAVAATLFATLLSGTCGGRSAAFTFAISRTVAAETVATEPDACPGFCAPLVTPAADLRRCDVGGVFMV